MTPHLLNGSLVEWDPGPCAGAGDGGFLVAGGGCTAEGSIGWHTVARAYSVHDKEGESRTASSPWVRWWNANGHGGCHLHFPHIRAIKFFLVLSMNPLHILSMCSIILDGDGFVQAVGNAVDQLCGSNYLVPLTKCRYCTTYTHSALYSVLRAFLHSIWNMKCTRNHERLLVKFIPHLQTIICDTPYTPHSTFVTIM